MILFRYNESSILNLTKYYKNLQENRKIYFIPIINKYNNIYYIHIINKGIQFIIYFLSIVLLNRYLRKKPTTAVHLNSLSNSPRDHKIYKVVIEKHLKVKTILLSFRNVLKLFFKFKNNKFIIINI